VQLPHLTPLDGLRGVAVAAVVTYHLNPDLLPGGFLGVDAFFVLSGFLIASLLITEIDRHGRIDLRAFYARRLRRLMPAALLVIAATAAYAAVWAGPAELTRLRSHGLWTLGWLANWRYLADGTTYTDFVVGTSPLRHTWSLAIEEQFYVVFPLLMVLATALIARRHSLSVLRWTVGLTAGVGAAASALWMAVVAGAGDGSGIDRAYFGTDTRVQALLVGVALATVVVGRPAAEGRFAVWAARAAVPATAGLVVMLVVVGERSPWMYRGGFGLAAVCVAVVIASLGRARWLAGPLSWRPVVALGLISYGVYLWHWPILVVFDEQRTGWSGLPLAALRIGLTLFAAIGSWRFVEQPVRSGSLRRGLGRWAPGAAPAGVAVAALALVMATLPSPGVFGSGAVTASAGLRSLPVPMTTPAPAPASPPVSTDATDTRDAPVSVVLIGDSVAHSLAGAAVHQFPDFEPWSEQLSPFDPTRVSLWTVTRPGCSFLPGRVIRGSDPASEGADLSFFCGDWRSDLVAAVQARDADVVVVALANDVRDRRVDGVYVPIDSAAWRALLGTTLDDMASAARRSGARLVLVTPAPRVGPYVEPGDEGGWREAAMTRALRSYAGTHDDVEVAEFAVAICPGGDCNDSTTGFDPAWRYDGLHYAAGGPGWFANWVTPRLVAAARR
jgi:peptidoglycan/LPS O-acetylase OafA/YrhL